MAWLQNLLHGSHNIATVLNAMRWIATAYVDESYLNPSIDAIQQATIEALKAPLGLLPFMPGTGPIVAQRLEVQAAFGLADSYKIEEEEGSEGAKDSKDSDDFEAKLGGGGGGASPSQ